MNTHRHKLPQLRRWAKFNCVGALGFCVQVCAAYIWIGVIKNSPLVATALAVETAVLHNFTWHYFLTWGDRRLGKSTDFFLTLLAFNATNGIVSLAGNLLFAWLILERKHLSPLLANFLAIALCSLINFALSEKVVFRIAPNRCYRCGISPSAHRVVRLVALVSFCFVASTITVRA
jgi:putative flippase GtrA